MIGNGLWTAVVVYLYIELSEVIFKKNKKFCT